MKISYDKKCWLIACLLWIVLSHSSLSANLVRDDREKLTADAGNLKKCVKLRRLRAKRRISDFFRSLLSEFTLIKCIELNISLVCKRLTKENKFTQFRTGILLTVSHEKRKRGR